MELTNSDIGKTFITNAGNFLKVDMKNSASGEFLLRCKKNNWHIVDADGKCRGQDEDTHDLVEEVKPEPEVYKYARCELDSNGTRASIPSPTRLYKTKEEILGPHWSAIDMSTGEVFSE